MNHDSNPKTLYLVTDVGRASPCTGIIAGIFDNLSEATQYCDQIKNDDAGKYGFWSNNDVGILTKVLGSKSQPSY